MTTECPEAIAWPNCIAIVSIMGVCAFGAYLWFLYVREETRRGK